MRRWIWGLVLISAFSGLLLAAVFWYGTRPEIPHGIYLADLPVSDLSPEELKEIGQKKEKELKDKEIEFTAQVYEKKNQRSLTLEKLQIQTNIGAVTDKIIQDYQNGSFFHRAWFRWQARAGLHYPIDILWDEEKTKGAIHKEWPELFQGQPVNANRMITDQDEVLYEEDQSAYHLDTSKWMEQLRNLQDDDLWSNRSLSIEMPMNEIKASVTLDALKSEGIERKIAEYTTHYSTQASGRTHNVEATAKVLHDTYLSADEIFSYEKVIQETEKNFGYQEAPVIMEGELRPGIGGGICQVSTTLYNAVLLSDLKVVERRNHSLPIGYAPLGRDATYADGGINFRFQNNTGKKLLIRSVIHNGQLTVKIFGTAPKDREIEIISETTDVIAPKTITKKAANLPAGTTRVQSKGKPGFKVRVYKLIKVNGEVKDKVLVSTDTYKAQPKILLVGTAAKKQEGVS